MEWVVAVVYAGFLAGTGALAVIDARTKRLPNRIVYPLFAFGLAGLALASGVGGEWWRLVVAGGSAVVLYGLFWLFWYFGPMGFGDVKLAGLLGLFLGWVGLPAVVSGLLLGMLAAAFSGIGMMLIRKATLKTELAYGPYLIAGAWAALALELATAR